jgi:uncharacterized Zn finger protein
MMVMAKRKAKKKVPRRASVTKAADRLRKVLSKQPKAVLLDLVVDFASKDRTCLRKLEAKFHIEAPPEDLVVSTKAAITDATDFDESQMNYNFDYDYQAYSTVQKNLKRLVDLRCFDEAMELSLDLMSKGSYQVEMSDEGMMTGDIDDCLQVVVKALKKSDLPAKKVLNWCAAIVKKDRVGFICEDQLKALRKHLQAVS